MSLKLAGPAPHRGPSHQARGPSAHARPWAHGSGARRGGGRGYKAPKKRLPVALPAAPPCPPQRGALEPPPDHLRGVRVLCLPVVFGKGLPLATGLRGFSPEPVPL